MLFALPLAIETRFRLRRLTWLGTQLCDYNGPLLSAGFSRKLGEAGFAALWNEILAAIRVDPRLRFDVVDLAKMPEIIGAEPNPFMALEPTLDPSGAYLATLGGDWDAFYAEKRSAATRKRERRQFKQLAKFGDVRFVEPTEHADVERTLEALFTQKAASLARMGVENFLAKPGHQDFFRAIATSAETSALAHVTRVDVGSTMAATGFGLQLNGRYYLLLSSYEDGELSRYGPGRAHLHELLRRAITKGFGQFDFTVGDEPYKRDWSDVTVRLYGHFAATSLRGWPVFLATVAFRRTKRLIKQNPLLWRLFSEARARLRKRRAAHTEPVEAAEG